VLLVSWAEEPLPQGGHVDVEGYLAAHQVAAQVCREARSPRDVGPALAQLCGEVGAGLLVMGCYSRPRLRERVLGGATRSLLRALPLPVLMAH
jgi:nucleotide-binding universal stress UspA family protein